MKVAIAMSGGVDSSVAAALLCEKYGKENLIGLTMKLFCYGEAESGEKSCCSLASIDDARKVCQSLGIAHYVVDLEKEFEQEVIGDFVSEYEQGLTPNPCVRCNNIIKFKYLYNKAKKIGCETLATGHYAIITKELGSFKLYKGKDETKDQSYFLAGLNQEQLAHTLFPLGGLTKVEVRELADKYNLVTAQKAESQDICFVTDTTENFLTSKAKHKEGRIVDVKGKQVGTHQGIPFYTIGQRKGLGGGFSDKMYVVGINNKTNEVVVGEEADLYRDKLSVRDINWIDKEPSLPCKLTTKIRYQSTEAECVLSKNDNYLVSFTEKQKAITPGQLIVFYEGNEVVGSGIIRA